MRKVVLRAILVWCLCAVGATDYENTDYWYSNDDGIILDSLTPVSLYRSRNENETSILRSHDDIATKKIRKSKPSWFLKFEKFYPERNRTYLRTFTPPPFKKDPVLARLEQKRTPEETWSCSDGPTKKLDCNQCICIGGQLYLCTAKRCLHPDATGIQVLKSYRERRQEDCVEGEHIQSFDCNKCWCSGGKIICTQVGCNRGTQTHGPHVGRSLTDASCVPGEPLPSPDECNTCGCTNRGEKYCTAVACGIKPKQIKDQDVGCVPQTWFSLYGSSTCKECYCTDGKMAFCYLKLCAADRMIQQKGYKPVKMMSAMKTSTCNKGAVMFDECSKCICTYKEQWKCFTRLINKCSGAETEIKTQTPRPAEEEGNQGYNEESKPKKPKTKEGNKKHTKKPKKGKGKKKPKQPKKTTPPEYSYESIDVDDISTRLPLRRPKRPKQPPKKKPTKRPRPSKPRPGKIDVDVGVGVDVNVNVNVDADADADYDIEYRSYSRNPHRSCNVGELFTQGYASNCQGCFCTAEGKWNCFSVAGPCREWKSCWAGAYEKNTQIPCSVCYCGANGKFMCAVDEHCSQKLKSSSCESIDCEKTCQLKKRRDGFCHRDKCTCV